MSVEPLPAITITLDHERPLRFTHRAAWLYEERMQESFFGACTALGAGEISEKRLIHMLWAALWTDDQSLTPERVAELLPFSVDALTDAITKLAAALERMMPRKEDLPSRARPEAQPAEPTA